MSRSTYIYVVSYAERVGVSAPILARTVKYELVAAMAHFPAAMLADVEVCRMVDGGAAYNVGERTHLGTGAEFLARESAVTGR
jgi:hypothetical protein